MSKFNVGDRITHPTFGGAVVKAIDSSGDPLVRRDDGATGGGTDGLWIAMSDTWTLEEPASTGPTEAEQDERRLQSTLVNTAAMLQAIDSGEVPEDQVSSALYGMSAACVHILRERFGGTLDERIAARKVAIAEFAA